MGELAIVCNHTLAATDGPVEIGVIGPIGQATTRNLRDYLRLVIEASGARGLRLDLSCCTSINVDGMLALSVAQHAARSQGGDLRLVDVPPLIELQFRQHNLEHLLDTASNRP